MVLLQLPQFASEQLTQIGRNIPFVTELLPSILAFSLVFFVLSLIKLDLKIRIIAGLVLAAVLVAINFLPADISSKVTPFTSPVTSVLTNTAKSMGFNGTLMLSVGLVVGGIVLSFFVGRLSGKALLKKVVKKAGEPNPKLEKALENLEKQRDQLISQLKHAKGNPAAELNVEKKINKINEKINILKAKLGLPITA